ncbi:MAG TPA: dephospho-CoA kinase [Firmicutes bacterium]|nr:dephospho-CoA kinase [Bacillota bacterium]
MVKVGLTGGIACGKSMVAAMLVRKGALLLDADLLAREVVAPGEPAWREIKDWLGDTYLHEDGTLHRERIAGLVFSSAAAREKLNNIVHPRVIELLRRRSAALEDAGPDEVQVWDVPLLFEAGMNEVVDLILVVAAREDVQVQRLVQRDGLRMAQALWRIRAQMPLAEKIRSADYVVYNNGTLKELSEQVDRFWQEISDRLF